METADSSEKLAHICETTCCQIPEDHIQFLLENQVTYVCIWLFTGPAPAEKWPVVVWFHPGNFSVGTTALWDGSALAVRQKVRENTPHSTAACDQFHLKAG
jgi:carboxylesterase type B